MRWSLPKASTLMSCKSYFPISLSLTLLPSLKLANPSSQALFPDYIAHSVSTTIKRRGIQKYATHPDLEYLPLFVIHASPQKDSDALRCGHGAPTPGCARPGHRSVAFF